MATSITQAKPLLTAAELELFEHSRAEPIKAFNPKQLASKEKRTRTLRDKYRDLFRRQTVAQRGTAGTGKGGKAGLSTGTSGEANARTQRKSEIMQEVLERFEARSALLESRSQKEADQKPKKMAGKPAARLATAQSPVNSKKPASVKASSTAKAAAPAKATANSSGDRSVKAKAGAGASSKVGSASSAGTKGVANPRKPRQAESPLSAVNDLKNGAGGAVQVEHLTGQDPTERSHKAPSDMAPTYGGKAQAPDINAPIDMVPAAKRGNPVRNMPGNIAIQGHVSSSIRRAQGKKDSR